MYTYLYDGTFDGLLTAYFYAYKDSQIYDICPAQLHQPSLHSIIKEIHTESDKAERIRKSVYTNLSSTVMYNLYLQYLWQCLCCSRGADTLVQVHYNRAVRSNTADIDCTSR